jgi:hypothetical protein
MSPLLYIRSLLLFILLGFALQGCGQSNQPIETYDQYRTQKLELRDSLFILHTVREWNRMDWWTFGGYTSMYKMTNDQIEYFFGGAFYSPDRLKMMVWLGDKMPNAETIEIYNKENPEVNRHCPNGADTVYSLSALIGCRDSVNQIWKLYPFNQRAIGCSPSKKIVIDVISEFYFTKMKNIQMFRIVQSGDRKGNKEPEAYGYNLQDKDFWTKCWLFEKDTVGSYGLYPFQIKGYRYIGKPCTPKSAEPYDPPKVTYPKEILDFYNQTQLPKK